MDCAFAKQHSVARPLVQGQDVTKDSGDDLLSMNRLDIDDNSNQPNREKDQGQS